jgi:hypothetical protein
MYKSPGNKIRNLAEVIATAIRNAPTIRTKADSDLLQSYLFNIFASV